jgi:hypothetical protein
MKRVVVLFSLLILLLAPSAFSQDETLLGSNIDHGGFGGPVVKLTSIRGEVGSLVGGYGGWLIGHQFLIGGGGYGLVNDIRADVSAEQRYTMDQRPLFVEFGYGGVVLEYIAMPSRAVHFSVMALLGAGSATYRENSYNDWNFDSHGHSRIDKMEALFVAEPQVNIELNMTDWFRVTLGGSYRFVRGVNDLTGLSNKDLSGPAGSVSFKFGSF